MDLRVMQDRKVRLGKLDPRDQKDLKYKAKVNLRKLLKILFLGL